MSTSANLESNLVFSQFLCSLMLPPDPRIKCGCFNELHRGAPFVCLHAFMYLVYLNLHKLSNLRIFIAILILLIRRKRQMRTYDQLERSVLVLNMKRRQRAEFPLHKKFSDIMSCTRIWWKAKSTNYMRFNNQFIYMEISIPNLHIREVISGSIIQP